MKIIKVSKWELPEELFERYLRVVEVTEKSSVRYNYDFDELRRSIHDEILNHLGLMVHMKEYRDFQRALQNLCEEMLPARFAPVKITKLNNPCNSLRKSIKV